MKSAQASSSQDFDHNRLFEEILAARERVYSVGEATPLQQLPLPDLDAQVWVKREDLGPIKAYKWRGAYNAMAALTAEQRSMGVVAASAGNHAQGVALAAKALGCQAVIFMPRSTPEVKQSEVRRFGGDHVEIRLIGDTYDDAGHAARTYCEETSGVYIHPYDDEVTMGGQGTLADEVVMSGKGPFDRVYVAIGGGGLAAALACWLKRYWPEVKVYGVEGVEQASMTAALAHGSPVELDYVDVFCDGTAVRKVGSITFEYCRSLLDGVITVTNDEVCDSIRTLWETLRVIPEPSGAMGLAGLKKHYHTGEIGSGEKVLTVISGANMDFAQLSGIAQRAGIGSKQRRFLRVPIPEGKGSLVEFLEQLPEEISIVDLQYGRNDSEVQFPVLGLIGSESDYQQLDAVLAQRGANASDVSTDEDVDYRIINYAPELFHYPLFINIEFPERAGAFLRFMNEVKDIASLCYFNYSYSGERVGRALVGMEFNSADDQQACLQRILAMCGKNIRAAREVSDETFYRLTGHSRG
ncbi:pyridoxal-phosphate dependent enzyme [Verrucomicrobiaceae bacterium 5K15]|uniref:threonine ammonia-lyase n=1 Tax=Oceaniferula flava TaxID=2800421 RepID=A0AAE2SDE2_9BACT|nr:pyridoxal-phosphate dependent enzyme [Oceaniferula flavus]MBK1856145.1 pyridoxal-phosphate dependent enzyme [Oceaniferula flavus]MBM1137452.1 pyridoxal-phosphate dependent enzyme [Oceaniferula flavus]